MCNRTLRIRVIAEGPSDFHVIRAGLRSLLGDQHEINLLYPEFSVGFMPQGQYGFGWKGVFRKISEFGARDPAAWAAFWTNADILVVHLDAEVAWEKDTSVEWADVDQISVNCPPCEAAPQALRTVMRQRLRGGGSDPRVLFAIPSMETECWLLPLYRPAVTPNECAPKPSHHFQGGRPKLVEQSGKKPGVRYRQIEDEIKEGWPRIVVVPQALTFQNEVKACARWYGLCS